MTSHPPPKLILPIETEISQKYNHSQKFLMLHMYIIYVINRQKKSTPKFRNKTNRNYHAKYPLK